MRGAGPGSGVVVALDDDDAALRRAVVDIRAQTTACAQCGMPVTHRVRAITDPVARSKAATEAITTILAEVGLLAAFRREAVQEMRAGMTQREVAAVLRISQARVAQIEHGTASC